MNEKNCILIQISLKFLHKGPIDKKISIGSGNGSAPAGRQAITWINADPVYQRIYSALGGDELMVAAWYMYVMECDWYGTSHHWVCMVIADSLALIRCQAINYHHDGVGNIWPGGTSGYCGML